MSKEATLWLTQQELEIAMAAIDELPHKFGRLVYPKMAIALAVLQEEERKAAEPPAPVPAEAQPQPSSSSPSGGSTPSAA